MKTVIRRYLLLILTICAFLAAMAFGIVKRQTYRDTLKQEDYLDQLLVGELWEDYLEVQCANMQQSLPDAPIILWVETLGKIEHLFNVDRQRVLIRKIYAGAGLETGEEVYLFSRHWQLSLDGYYDSLERGYVNILEVGTEYLVFAEEVLEDMEGDLRAVKLYDDFSITPVFCYEERQNVIMPITGDTSFVPYKEVRNNEFFVTSEKALKMLEELKRSMLSLYPRS